MARLAPQGQAPEEAQARPHRHRAGARAQGSEGCAGGRLPRRNGLAPKRWPEGLHAVSEACMRTCVVAVFSLSLGGCLNFGKVDDAKIPGELLGTYGVEGALVESDCGEGALGSTDDWKFDVKLSRFHDDLYWINGREVIPGGIAADGV